MFGGVLEDIQDGFQVWVPEEIKVLFAAAFLQDKERECLMARIRMALLSTLKVGGTTMVSNFGLSTSNDSPPEYTLVKFASAIEGSDLVRCCPLALSTNGGRGMEVGCW
jgi:hypothetical protein